MAHEQPPSTTVQVNPSNPAEDPEHPTWVQGQGYGREPDSSRSGSGDFNEVYEQQRADARERTQETEEAEATQQSES